MNRTTHRQDFHHATANRRRWPARRPAGHWRLVCSLSITYALILSLVGVPVASAQTGPQPGQKDPVSNYNYFPYHDMVAFAPGAALSVQGYRADQNLSLSGAFGYTQSADANQIVAAPGHIWTPQAEQVVYARRPNNGTDLHVTFVADPPTGGPSQVLPNLAPRFPTSADFMDIAAGDLDKLPDSAGDNHDEVVVAYASPGANNQLMINVAVLDYTAPATAPPSPVAVTTAQASHTINGNEFATAANPTGILPVDNVLGVAVGDFDGDGLKEIALVHLENHQTIWVTVFRYTNDGNGHRSLQEVSAASRAAAGQFSGTVDVAAADFDGQGKDEVLVGLAEWGAGSSFGQAVGFDVWQGDSNLTMTRTGAIGALGDSTQISYDDLGGRKRVQVSPGLFKYDPDNGFDLNRRQFVAAWNTPDGNLLLTTYEVADDLTTITQMNQLVWGAPPGYGLINQRFSVAAGAYKGNAVTPPPLWGIALATWPSSGSYLLATLNSNVTFADQFAISSGTLDGAGRYPVVPFDLDGKSIYLGAPIHFLIDGLVTTDFVLHEPPKHAFYDNRPQIIINGQPQANPAYGQIVTVSRYDETNVALMTKQGTTFSGKSTDTSNWSIGASVDVNARQTATAGVPDIASAKLSLEEDVKVSYDYNQNKENYNSNYSERTITQTEQTDHDDKLLGRTQTLDIWRYRVYGQAGTDPNGQPSNVFYEVVLPGPTLTFDSGGQNLDWYQPTHENGNILSYPQPSAGTFTPPDLGSHKEPCPSTPPGPNCNPDGTITISAPMIPAQQIFFDGTSGSLAYDYTNTTGSGTTFSYSHTLSESADVKYSSKVQIGSADEGEQSKFSVDVNLHNSNSWGNTTTSDSTTTSDTGLTLNRSSGDGTQAYAFYPVFYTTQDGTIKVSHAVEVLASATGRAFWAGMYGRLADPALNLPARFTPAYGPTNELIGWAPNYNSSRKKLRGFFLRRATPNPVTNTFDLLASTPLAGDTVRLDASVYNYSTAIGATALKVRFQVIGYNSDSDTEIPLTSCPNGATLDAASGRCTIGETIVPQLNPLQMTSATFDWDTTGFGPAGAGLSSDYRIYVVLDPDNTIAETYESEDPNTDYKCVDGSGNPCTLPRGVDPGQNNEGFGQITIQHPSLAAADNPSFGADVSLRVDSLAARNDRGSIRAAHTRARLLQPLRLRVKVYSATPHDDFSHVLVYDGDPEKGGQMIAGKLLHSGNPAGSAAWFEWIPRRVGTHTLHVKVVEKLGDPVPGNHTDTLTIEVIP